MKIIYLLYNYLGLPIFRAALFFLKFINHKVREGLLVRRDLLKSLEENVSGLDKNKINILFQCSSLGELEQAKPIAGELDETGEYNFIFSFFSSSGYKNSGFDFIKNSRFIKTYLPIDSEKEIKKFVELANPSTAIFIKYDLWFNFIYELKAENTTCMLLNATFNESRLRYKFPLIKSYYKCLYGFFDHIFTIDKEDKAAFVKFIGTDKKIIVSGDTKIERINQAFEKVRMKQLLNENIIKNKKVFVVGSSWHEDEELILPALNRLNNGKSNDFLTLMVPHEPSNENINNIENLITEKYSNIKYIKFSDIDKYKDQQLIIVDTIGQLFTLYKYADIAYVGGSYHAGLHNVMEPARYNIPVMFGDDRTTDDADYLLNKGIGIRITGSNDVYDNLIGLYNNKKDFSNVIYSTFLNKTRTTEIIAKLINKTANVQ